MTAKKTAKKATSKKAPTKKAPSRKTAAKKAPSKKVPAKKKTASSKAPSKKVPTGGKAQAGKKTAKKKAAAKKKAPAKKTAVKKTSTRKVPARKAVVKKTPRPSSSMEAVPEWVEAKPLSVHSITLKQISASTKVPTRRTADRRDVPDVLGKLVDPVRRLCSFLGRTHRMSNENMVRRCQYLSGSFQPKTM